MKATLAAALRDSKRRPIPASELPDEDGIPLESSWHRSAMNLLIEIVHWYFRGRTDFYVGGKMFIHYYDKGRLRHIFRGPDFFFVNNVDGTRGRRFWYVEDEDRRYPDVIIELMSPTTAKADRTTKKKIYEKTFKTRDYFLYDSDTEKLKGWRLKGDAYERIEPNRQGWLWCEELGLWLGKWPGTYQSQEGIWPRFYDTHGAIVPLNYEAHERAIALAKKRIRAA